MEIQDLVENVRSWITVGELHQSLTYRVDFADSKLHVTVSLDKGSTKLDYDVRCDWQERGRAGKSVPQLNFYAPLPMIVLRTNTMFPLVQ